MENIPIVQGRRLISNTAVELRHQFLKENGFNIEKIKKHRFDKSTIQNNIESFVGSVEIPVGIAGPLLFKHKNSEEIVYTLVGTLEGALVASMNRGAKAVSRSGGFTAAVLHQKMIRAPLFIFNNLEDALTFKHWLEPRFSSVKEITKEYSNHADLKEIQTYIAGKNVHLKFIYTTGDASGQNMTTSCTWHAMLWIAENFTKETKTEIEHFIIEGNASSDKKVSQASFINGRGIHVTAECFLEEKIINKILRTNSEDILRYFGTSLSMSKINGMSGYNINVANAIAAVFVATGQDLGSIHESATGILNIEKTETGLYLSLNLPSLVIGTVGGGTHLPEQKEALEIMGCSGTGKVERFAKIIAGFALSLEISTYAAIVSGEFAKAHEKLGRNKPVYRLLKSEINTDFIKNCLSETLRKEDIISAKISKRVLIDNGIITNITNRVSKRIIGFIPVTIQYKKENEIIKDELLLKSKAPDIEVINGLHKMAASINPELSDLIFTNSKNLEYRNIHKKEIKIYKTLYANNFKCTPKYYGQYIDAGKEIYILALEILNSKKLRHINSENNPEIWTSSEIKETIRQISYIHQFFQSEKNRTDLKEIQEFHAYKSASLYKKMIKLIIDESENEKQKSGLKSLLNDINTLKNSYNRLQTKKTIIHNDFNSRNIAVRKDGQTCIYDWELAVVNIPQRDIVEFLSFVLPENFSKELLNDYIDFHLSLYEKMLSSEELNRFKKEYVYAVKEYLITRVSFYEAAGIIMKYKFSNRVLTNSFRMLDYLKKYL